MRDEELDGEVMYYVVTSGGYRMGPYDSYTFAWYAGLENFGLGGWKVSEIKGDRGD